MECLQVQASQPAGVCESDGHAAGVGKAIGCLVGGVRVGAGGPKARNAWHAGGVNLQGRMLPRESIGMGMTTRCLLLTLGLIATGCASAPPPKVAAPADPAPAAAARDAAAEALFNGHDLSGWVALGTAHWRAEDGVIVGTQDGDPSRHGLLATRKSYKDFELSLDFELDEHGKYNSGVYLRNEPGVERQTGYQVNIGRGVAGEYCGGIYRNGWLAKGDVNDVIRRPGKWNTLHIVADGPHVTVDLNGVRVSDFTETTPDPKLLGPGVIGLQTYGAEHYAGWVKFRNLMLREIHPPEGR
jgi:hypothetical protein